MVNEKADIVDFSFDKTINLFSNKWKILIIESLLNEKRRFNELKRLVRGISAKVLTDNLRRLEEEGFVKRNVILEVPVKVEYALTDYGKSLAPVIHALTEWREMNHSYGSNNSNVTQNELTQSEQAV